MDEILALSVRGREEKTRTSDLEHQIAVQGQTLSQLLAEEQGNTDAFEIAREGYAERIAAKQQSREYMEEQLEEATHALSNLEEHLQTLESENDAVRSQLQQLRGDKSLLLSGICHRS
jgi:chromosome segregation ATPase